MFALMTRLNHLDFHLARRAWFRSCVDKSREEKDKERKNCNDRHRDNNSVSLVGETSGCKKVVLSLAKERSYSVDGDSIVPKHRLAFSRCHFVNIVRLGPWEEAALQ